MSHKGQERFEEWVKEAEEEAKQPMSMEELFIFIGLERKE